MQRAISLKFLLIGFAALIFSGCATSSSTIEVDVPSNLTELTNDERERLLRNQSEQWRGTPHVLGGTTTRGVDCSGLVQTFYSAQFDISMPRTTEWQVRAGEEVSRVELKPGDLVFFRPTPKTRHVGIYLSDDEFVHAASSSGVSIDNLNGRYWGPRFWTARRVLPEPDVSPNPEIIAEERDTTGNETVGVRSGW